MEKTPATQGVLKGFTLIEPRKYGGRDRRNLIAAFGSLCIVMLMVALDATSLAVALPVITKALNGSAVEGFWSGTSFLLASTVFQPILGSFSNVFGRKPLINVSLTLFLMGSVVIAVATNFTVVLVGRTIQGAGGGGILCLTALIIVDKIPLKERGKWFSSIGAMWSIGTVTGPLLGGGLAKEALWRWIFWINIPFICIGGISIAIFLKFDKTNVALVAKMEELDWVGMSLFLASITGFLIPITRGGVECPWNSWRTLVPLFLCIAGLMVFALHQEYVAKNPFIPIGLFKNRSAAIIYVQTVIYGIILSMGMFYLPLYFEAAKDMSPVMAGVSLFPWTFTLAPAAMVVGIAVSKTGAYRWAIWLGWCLVTFSMSLLVLLKSDTPTAAWVSISLVGGIGLGALYPAMILGVQASSTVENQAPATNMFTFSRALGQTLGVAVGGVMFQNMIEKRMLSKPLLAMKAKEYSKDAIGLVQIIKAMPMNNAKEQLIESFTYALSYIWVVAAVIAGIALLASIFIEAYQLNNPLAVDETAKDDKN
ncbi:hypothetical protein COCMIDRAFT_108604 [Bipolaris oryzae ATCC 44560]|uniref:Major facilitator superfamily (MFS) profile domain-containing protein n=1 Tax=Bipolaris oryzae ATCC 44560 TaxID=930090 RepID=W6YML9_COCMI|nr:uncharacterized protein COCMIDRAFT_108604 [Bipolaris oryzae ATCC 44560]EUC40527.1 hypothetical protein COCMIDRAFT_108604 [Bipolaris oryzae ATCC 44560]